MDKKQVLLYEQDQGVRLIMERSLSKFINQIKLFSSHNKEKIRNIIKAGNVDLLITDLSGIDQVGLDLTQFARRYSPNINIIWITVFSCYAYAEEKKRYGNIVCIEKPIDIQCFRQCVLQILHLIST